MPDNITLISKSDASWMRHSHGLEQILDDALTAYDRLAVENGELHREVKRLRAALAEARRPTYYRRFCWAAVAAGVMTMVAVISWLTR